MEAEWIKTKSADADTDESDSVSFAWVIIVLILVIFVVLTVVGRRCEAQRQEHFQRIKQQQQKMVAQQHQHNQILLASGRADGDTFIHISK